MIDMERKIGEIFEYNGGWYQVVEKTEKSCKACYFYSDEGCFASTGLGRCRHYSRNDNKSVIFKKLEKVGEPITVNGKNVQFLKTTIANCDNCAFYKDVNCDFTCYPRKCHGGEEGIYVEIKQNKEDMEEKNNAKHSNSEKIGKNLKPFDLEAAKSGKPVCTRDGRKAIFLTTLSNKNFPVVAIVSCGQEENIYQYDINGVCDEHDENLDLMMLPEKKEGWINIYNADTTFYYVDGRVFETKDEAVQEAKEKVEKEQREKNEYINTIRVEWEE